MLPIIPGPATRRPAYRDYNLDMKTGMKVVVLLALNILVLVFLELGSYAFLRFVLPRDSRMWRDLGGMVANFHPLFKAVDGNSVSRYYPYVGHYWQGDWSKTIPPAAEHPDGWVLPGEKDDQGRQKYVTMDKPEGMIRIFCIGGSTMMGAGTSGPDKTISAGLQALLRAANPDRKIEVINAAWHGHVSTEEMVLIATKLIAYHPDMFVVLDGFNDFGRAYFMPSMPPFWTFFQQTLVRERNPAMSFRGIIANLVFFLRTKFYCLAIIPMPRLHGSKPLPGTGAAARGKPFDPRPYLRALDEYQLVQTSMAGIARAHGVPIALALQPNVVYRKPMSAEEKREQEKFEASKPKYREARIFFFYEGERRRAALSKKLSAKGVYILSFTRLFERKPQTLYTDSCHYNDEGARLIAEAYFPVVAAALGLNANPPARR